VVSRFLLKIGQAVTMRSLPNIQVVVSTLQTLLTSHNCKIKSRMLVQQDQMLHHVTWNIFYGIILWWFCWYHH